ncbi:hypothetical protein RJT34_14724 [Clitoria ternatea]|uniref:Uncharacterized protein n=1 Tax=Clitoria ternatea TaxID=43366 RepID=A0AAN9JRA0_CLITE
MLSSLLFKSFLSYPKGIVRLPLHHFLSTFSDSSITSEKHTFTVSYLINNCGFSPQTALKASRCVQFETPQKPDSVIAFFSNNGFTNSQINSIIRRAPNVLTCDPRKRISPKFEFLLSKGASSSDIVEFVNRSPRILYSSLQHSIIPNFDLVRRFFNSDKITLYRILGCRHFFGDKRVEQNLKLLADEGVKDSNISFLLSRKLSILLSSDMRGPLNEVKQLGFDSSKVNFVIALLAKMVIPKPRWDAKVNAFKSWGWSEEMVLCVFKKRPLCMLHSEDKINKVMRFWVNELGWSSLALAKGSEILALSLEKRIIPRAFVLKYLIAKGLRKKSASLVTPFALSEELFLEKYVKRFEEETRKILLKIYQEKMGVEEKRERDVASGSFQKQTSGANDAELTSTVSIKPCINHHVAIPDPDYSAYVFEELWSKLNLFEHTVHALELEEMQRSEREKEHATYCETFLSFLNEFREERNLICKLGKCGKGKREAN